MTATLWCVSENGNESLLSVPKHSFEDFDQCRAAGDFLAQRAECFARKRKLRYNYRRTAFTAVYGGALIGTPIVP